MPVVLVTIEHAGRLWRLSSRPLDVVDGDGVSHLYRGGLAPLDVYAEAIPFGESSPQSQTFEALISVDVAALVSEHHLTSEARAEVATIEERPSTVAVCGSMAGSPWSPTGSLASLCD